jgi:hypothetical protein
MSRQATRTAYAGRPGSSFAAGLLEKLVATTPLPNGAAGEQKLCD